MQIVIPLIVVFGTLGGSFVGGYWQRENLRFEHTNEQSSARAERWRAALKEIAKVDLERSANSDENVQFNEGYKRVRTAVLGAWIDSDSDPARLAHLSRLYVASAVAQRAYAAKQAEDAGRLNKGHEILFNKEYLDRWWHPADRPEDFLLWITHLERAVNGESYQEVSEPKSSIPTVSYSGNSVTSQMGALYLDAFRDLMLTP